MSMYLDIPLNRLVARDQVRKTFNGIEGLADSIHEHGLLENLVVTRSYANHHLPVGEGGIHFFDIVAGERRFRALTRLKERGTPWNVDETGVTQVPCLVVEGDIDWIQAVENLQRQEVPMWQMGHRFRELVAAGSTQQQVASRLGISQGKVSKMIIIATNLSPEVVSLLEKSRGYDWKERDLMRMANLVDRRGEPDPKAQVAVFNKLLDDPEARPGSKRRTVGLGKNQRQLKEVVFQRYTKLRDREFGPRMTVDEERFLEQVLRYLDGRERRLSFRDR